MTVDGVTTGVLGARWRATVTPAGVVVPWEGEPLRWWVAASDRWHDPSAEPSVRQQRVDGTPVTETRLRIPNGDAVQRVWSVADGGGLTSGVVENDSPSPIAVAFDRRDVLTERPIPDVPIEGIDLPAGSFVLPVGHRARVRVAVPHGPVAASMLPATVVAADRVVAGWRSVLDRGGRLDLPGASATWGDVVRAERAEVQLAGPPTIAVDPAGFLLAVSELADGMDVVPEVAEAIAALGAAQGWDADAARRAAARVLAAAGEERAERDLARIVGALPATARPATCPEGVRAIPWCLEQAACDGALLPGGWQPDWLGASVEVHDVPLAAGAWVSFAVRWHGERPAVLWERRGRDVVLRAPVVAPGWSTSAPSGEALWPAPQGSSTTASP